MLKCGFRWTVIIVSSVLPCVAHAQGSPTTADGLYRILSGDYRECCGITGTDVVYPLPDAGQSFVRLNVDPSNGTATLTLLGSDAQTVFGRVPCEASGAISFQFPYGLALSNGFFFHVDPGPPPYQSYWNYTASNSASLLRIDGILGLVSGGCSDTPTRFSHSNVLAVLVPPPPRLSVVEVTTNHVVRLLIQGNPGETNLVEASQDLSAWVPVSTNVMDNSTCPSCPFAIFEDPAVTNFSSRFYRVSELR